MPWFSFFVMKILFHVKSLYPLYQKFMTRGTQVRRKCLLHEQNVTADRSRVNWPRLWEFPHNCGQYEGPCAVTISWTFTILRRVNCTGVLIKKHVYTKIIVKWSVTGQILVCRYSTHGIWGVYWNSGGLMKYLNWTIFFRIMIKISLVLYDKNVNHLISLWHNLQCVIKLFVMCIRKSVIYPLKITI